MSPWGGSPRNATHTPWTQNLLERRMIPSPPHSPTPTHTPWTQNSTTHPPPRHPTSVVGEAWRGRGRGRGRCADAGVGVGVGAGGVARKWSLTTPSWASSRGASPGGFAPPGSSLLGPSRPTNPPTPLFHILGFFRWVCPTWKLSVMPIYPSRTLSIYPTRPFFSPSHSHSFTPPNHPYKRP